MSADREEALVVGDLHLHRGADPAVARDLTRLLRQQERPGLLLLDGDVFDLMDLRLMGQLDLPRRGHAVDLACGTGRIGVWLHQRGLTATGVDLTPAMLAKARARGVYEQLLEGPLDTTRAVAFSRQIANGLQAAHDQGVVHRDLKAENIMITPDGDAKILDFGLAKRFERDDSEESLTEEGMVMGTTRAMSPEQAEGSELDHRSDLFSLGSLLYEMVSGRHPFQASSPLETMQRVVRHHPTPVRRIDPHIPEELELLIERLLEKDRELRPPTARKVSEALAALTEILVSTSGQRAALDEITTQARRHRRSRWWWLLAAPS